MTTTADTSPISLDGDLQTLGVEHFSQCVNVMAQAFCDSPAYKVGRMKIGKEKETGGEWMRIPSPTPRFLTKTRFLYITSMGSSSCYVVVVMGGCMPSVVYFSRYTDLPDESIRMAL